MAFEIYRKTRLRKNSTEPIITLTAGGILSFSPVLTAKHLNGSDFVQLCFDPDTKRVGVRPAKEGDPDAFKLTSQARGRRKTLGARSFLLAYNIRPLVEGRFERHEFRATWEEGMLVFDSKPSKPQPQKSA